MTNIQTPQGTVKLLAPTAELMRSIRTLLPFGAVGFREPQGKAKYGLVMQCGERELRDVKQQPPDCDDQSGPVCYEANSILIADSLAGYLAHGFSGVFLPCAYFRKKEGGRMESGIAYFGYPSPRGHEAQEYPYERAYDGEFGHGFTKMMTSFIRALKQSAKDTGIPLSPCIGLDVRRRMQLGSLGFGFMLVGPHVVCLKTALSERDPVWTALRSTGIAEVFHIPSVPTTINEDQLQIARPTA